MNWDELYRLQGTFDKKIRDKSNLTDKEIIECKFVELSTEIGELANEVKSHKYWSIQPPSAKHIILEEYADILAMVMSLGNDFGFRYHHRGFIIESKQHHHLNHILNDLFLSVSLFRLLTDESNYDNLMEHLLLIGMKLGFSVNDVYDAYLTKNRINHERQASEY